jgi:hypothetical protein
MRSSWSLPDRANDETAYPVHALAGPAQKCRTFQTIYCESPLGLCRGIVERSRRARKQAARLVRPMGPSTARDQARPALTPSPPPPEFFSLLVATTPHAEWAEGLQLFGQFVGSWLLTVRTFDDGGNVVDDRFGVWTFGWVLDGRAIQDVIAYPERPAGLLDDRGSRRIGTYLRFFDAESKRWLVVFLGATRRVLTPLTTEVENGEIRLEGTEPDGARWRRVFSEITDDRFRFTVTISQDSGANWKLHQEIVAFRYRRRR